MEKIFGVFQVIALCILAYIFMLLLKLFNLLDGHPVVFIVIVVILFTPMVGSFLEKYHKKKH